MYGYYIIIIHFTIDVNQVFSISTGGKHTGERAISFYNN